MKQKGHNQWIPLEKGDFYHNEQGLMVFTSRYLIKRGYCCESGCKHCPYGFKGSTKSMDI